MFDGCESRAARRRATQREGYVLFAIYPSPVFDDAGGFMIAETPTATMSLITDCGARRPRTVSFLKQIVNKLYRLDSK
jgi:hypothetical protein